MAMFEVLPFTDELVTKISRLNGYMTPTEVRTVLESYKPVYTSFAFIRESGKENLSNRRKSYEHWN
jgi:hypothetical protein